MRIASCPSRAKTDGMAQQTVIISISFRSFIPAFWENTAWNARGKRRIVVKPGFRDWLRADFAKASSRRALFFAPEAYLEFGLKNLFSFKPHVSITYKRKGFSDTFLIIPPLLFSYMKNCAILCSKIWE
jgi:hypothetical protein